MANYFTSSLHQEGGFELHNFTSRWNWDLDLKGSISIEKVDSEDSSIKLSGAVFEVKDSEAAVVDTITTDENEVDFKETSIRKLHIRRSKPLQI